MRAPCWEEKEIKQLPIQSSVSKSKQSIVRVVGVCRQNSSMWITLSLGGKKIINSVDRIQSSPLCILVGGSTEFLDVGCYFEITRRSCFLSPKLCVQSTQM
jgi:hypothetical protein